MFRQGVFVRSPPCDRGGVMTSRRYTLAALAGVLSVLIAVLGLAAFGSGATAAGKPTGGFCDRHAANPKCVTPTPTPTPTATVTPTPTPTPTSTPISGTWSCTVPLGQNCGAYQYAGIPNSNGYNTYVANQNTGAYGTETVYANSPGDWQVVANLSDCGGCVQTYPDVQQLFNNYCGNATWGCAADTPVDDLATLRINYDETSPASGASYEFSPDIWTDGYPNDVMFWVDTLGRCEAGSYGGTLLGHATFAGQNWTVHRYGGAGAEIIFVLDGPGGPGTCAQQSSGAIDIKAGLAWLSANVSDYPAHPVLSQVNTGWEITQASNATFTVHSYSITAN
jgi:hypothetical protein